MTTATRDTYNNLDAAYEFFNKKLFDGDLPKVAITLTRGRKFYGYFQAHGFRDRDGAVVPEIALNPDHMHRLDLEVLSTLVHEMCHVWQHYHGNPSRTTYHNQEFSDMMESIGLVCSDTGAPGGKKTGQKISHYIAGGGAFERAANIYRRSVTDWASIPQANVAKAKKNSKVKYTCSECGQNAWAKPGANLICGECFNDEQVFHMWAEDTDEQNSPD